MKVRLAILIVCWMSSFIHGMDKDNMPITKIKLIEVRSLDRLDYEVPVIVAGRNQQLWQQGFPLHDKLAGRLYYSQGNIICLPKQINYEPFDYSYGKNRNSNSVRHTMMLSRVILVAEPRLAQEECWDGEAKKYTNNYVYETVRAKLRAEKIFSTSVDFRGVQALEEAKKDLAWCYQNALNSFARDNRSSRKIAFLPLGLRSGIPWKDVVKIAVDTIFAYVHKKPHDYDSIWLCIVHARENGNPQPTDLYEYYKELCDKAAPALYSKSK